MAIQTNYTVTDEAEDGFENVSVAGEYSVDQDAFVITLHQNGNDIIVTDEMVVEVMTAIQRLLPKPKA